MGKISLTISCTRSRHDVVALRALHSRAILMNNDGLPSTIYNATYRFQQSTSTVYSTYHSFHEVPYHTVQLIFYSNHLEAILCSENSEKSALISFSKPSQKIYIYNVEGCRGSHVRRTQNCSAASQADVLRHMSRLA